MKRIPVMTILAFALLAPNAALCGHHNTEAIKARVEEYFSQIREGDWKSACSQYAIGYTSYWRGADTRSSMDSEEIRQMWIDFNTGRTEAGRRFNEFPSHIKVKELGDAALVTLYLQGTNTWNRDGETRQRDVKWRVTLVYSNVDGVWMQQHAHYARMDPETEIPKEEE